MNNSQKLDLILEKVNKIDGIDKRLEKNQLKKQ
jgi:hypothetical protein